MGWWILGITCLACGGGTAAIASSKGRDAGLWFLCGVLLGPLALLIVGFMSTPSRDGKAGDAANLRRERVCPYCAEIILAEARLCKHCKSDVEPLPQDEEAQGIPRVNGEHVAIEKNASSNSAHVHRGAHASPSSVNPLQNNTKFLLQYMLPVFVVLGAITVFGFLNVKSSPEKAGTEQLPGPNIIENIAESHKNQMRKHIETTLGPCPKMIGLSQERMQSGLIAVKFVALCESDKKRYLYSFEWW